MLHRPTGEVVAFFLKATPVVAIANNK